MNKTEETFVEYLERLIVLREEGGLDNRVLQAIVSDVKSGRYKVPPVPEFPQVYDPTTSRSYHDHWTGRDTSWQVPDLVRGRGYTQETVTEAYKGSPEKPITIFLAGKFFLRNRISR